MSDYFAQDPATQLALLETAAREALPNWNIEGANLALIKHRENAVFRASLGAFQGALRLHRFGYHSQVELQSELQWMQALSDAGIHVPIVIPTDAGDLFVNQTADNFPGVLQIDLFEWIEGEQLGSVEEGVTDASEVAATYRAIGELAARVHNQATNWKLPQGFTRHAWDAEGIAGENPFWGQFWKLQSASPAEKKLLLKARERVYAQLSELPKNADNYSMIHADFAPENVMVENGTVRLIDFDDAGFGWHLFELVTSLYFIQGEPYFAQAKEALIEGYRRHREITDADLALLPLFFLARGLTYVGWVHTRQETETARELTPMILALACEHAENYLQT